MKVIDPTGAGAGAGAADGICFSGLWGLNRLDCGRQFVAFVVSVLFLSPDAARLRTNATLWVGSAAIVGGSCAFSACSSGAAPASAAAAKKKA